jgi:UDP-N-acetylglucosamine diphosphorylase / glucose-1-phosphate thymidylyltransferase / UDP-N-acetylgalactosamine diphosphorylase / glucosamine-1-phosphate N-acetyltransferase / galactosamine-1-phosphate N-acetyltransferase
MKIYIFEDDGYKNFLPLTYCKPVYDLRCGCFTIREKVEKNFKHKCNILTRPYLADFLREELPQYKVNQYISEDALLVNGRLIADKDVVKAIKYKKGKDKLFVNGEVLVAAYISRQTFKSLFEKCGNKLPYMSCLSDLPTHEVDVRLVNYPWDIIRNNGDEIRKDFQLMLSTISRKIAGKLHKGTSLINKREIIIGSGTEIFPGVVLNAIDGPIILGRNITVMSNAVICGPAFIGDDSIVKVGAKIYPNSSIGQVCKVGGEIDGTIIQSYSNKQHDGYLGHAYIGNWVNIGADTNNSDLKNNYSNVKVMLDGKLVDSGMKHFGMLIGDHSKTGINMMFDTGTVIGMGCNLYGAGLPSRSVPSFVSGSADVPYKTHTLEQFLETAKIVMSRRNLKMSLVYEKLIRKVFDLTQAERDAAKII